MEIVEVAPRDGLQNEAAVLLDRGEAAADQGLVAAGARRIEATSFVHPGLVPQMADAEAVAAALPRGQVSWIGLVLNDRGLDRAIAAGMDEANIVVVASETFSRRNQGMSIADAIDSWQRLVPAGEFGRDAHHADHRRRLRLSVRGRGQRRSSSPMCCPAAWNNHRTSSPSPTPSASGFLSRSSPSPTWPQQWQHSIPLRWHFHNTRNTGYANAITAAQRGASALDASAGGIGGCPFAPNATGNIATEDLLYLLHRSGIDTGIDPELVIRVLPELADEIGHAVPGQLSRAGMFPG